jgi:hypothetical protein
MSTVRCKQCGSDNVELRAWVKPNENNECTQIDFSNTELDNRKDCFCCDCEDNVELVIEN